jgi:hypothetical protein
VQRVIVLVDAGTKGVKPHAKDGTSVDIGQIVSYPACRWPRGLRVEG